MAKTRVSTILATNQHLIKGYVPTQGERLLDVLNSQATEYLQVEDVEVYRRYGTSPAGTLPNAVLRKSSIALALRVEPEHEAPQKRAAALVPRRRHPAFVIVLGYDIVGTVHLRGHADGINVLTLDFARFFPISQARVTYGGDQRQQIRAQVAIANRDFVSLLHIEDDAASKVDLPHVVRQILQGESPTATP